MKALASEPPVCGLAHPSPQLHAVLEKVCQCEAITKDAASMSQLQCEIPLLFELIRHLGRAPDYLSLVIT